MRYEKIHCLFEQSGTFKNVLKEMGYQAFDYDLENKFQETDYQLDLFNEIEKAYKNEPSIFDSISENDLIISFYPCTYFSVQNDLIWSRTSYNFKTWNEEKTNAYIENRLIEREKYFQTLLKYIYLCETRNLKMVFENPYTNNYLLSRNEIKSPSVVITNRRKMGDYMVKPTAFWFYNLEPTTFSKYKIISYKEKRVNNLLPKGIQRSLISKEFAKNFINTYILGY